jgi:hypothetical protein
MGHDRSNRKLLALSAVIVIAATAASAVMAAGNPDEDRTPIARCDSLPASASIEVFTAAQTRTVCAEMLRTLEEATIADLRSFSKTAVMLSANGYESEQYAEITRELVEIIRLRGLYNKEPRWEPTLEIVWKWWIAENGLISPRTIREFLASAEPQAAKSLSDDDLSTMIATMAVMHKRGD